MSKFSDYYLNKSVTELLMKLKEARINPELMERERLNALIMELTDRQLTEKERKIMATILSAESDYLKTDSEIENQLKSIEEDESEEEEEDDEEEEDEEEEEEDDDQEEDDDEEEDEKEKVERNIKAIWYHDWWGFMFTVAFSVAIGMLVAAYIIYLIIKNEIGRSF